MGRQRRIPQILTGETRSVIGGIFPPSQGWMFQTVALTRFAPRRSFLCRADDTRPAPHEAEELARDGAVGAALGFFAGVLKAGFSHPNVAEYPSRKRTPVFREATCLAAPLCDASASAPVLARFDHP